MRAFILAGLVSVAGIVPSLAKGEARLAAEALFAEEKIPELRIDLSSGAADRLRQQPRAYVTGTVREGDLVYTNVCIRLKGSIGSFRPLDDKPAFTLNFGRAAEGQKFHGLKKVHLNNSVQDHTYLSEKICRELFDAAGVPVPRAGHAVVELNGRPLGLYVLVEGVNKQFLGRYFNKTDGNLYDSHTQGEITRRMRVNSGENRKDPALSALAAAAQEPNIDQRLVKLGKALDLDRFLTFLAMEVMLCHWDGYSMNKNNYRIYHDPETDRLVFIPQGMDQTFQRQMPSIYPPMVGLVAKSALEVPQLRTRYRDRMAQLLTNTFELNAITNHIFTLANRIQPALAEVDAQAGAGYLAKARSFSRRIQQRFHTLEHQLLSPVPELHFDRAGIVSLSGWQGETNLGNAVVFKEKVGEKQSLLGIRAQANSEGSWRNTVRLNKGHYRFHGRLRLEGVQFASQDQKAGAGLRISGHKFGRQLAGTLPWTSVSFEFDVAQDGTEIELICDLHATGGQAWFDESSLLLIRVGEER